VVKKVIEMAAIWILCIALVLGLLIITLFVVSWACTAFGISCAEYFKHHHNHHHLAHPN
jgi:hypothetical protein